MDAYCPACAQPAPVPPEQGAPCKRCGAPLLLADRYAVVSAPPTGHSVDEVDGATPIRMGVDVINGQRVGVRLASPGTADRLEREATVLRGLNVPGVSRLLASVSVGGAGQALVFILSEHEPLEACLNSGMRSDAEAVRHLLTGLLTLLERLHGLSPPVFHRNLHVGNIAWDGLDQTYVWDFARATDTAEDHRSDLVLARPGFFPAHLAKVDPVEGDLYAVGAVAVNVLSRRSPETLPVKDGVPDFRPAVRVDEPLARFLERLLAAGTRRAFSSAAQARAELLGSGVPTAGGHRGLMLAVGAVVAMGVGAAFLVPLAVSPPAPAPVSKGVLTRTPPEPAPAPTAPNPTAAPVTFTLESTPAGAEVWVDGRALGKTPVTSDPITAGAEVLVESRLAGHQPIRQKLTLREDRRLHWSFRPLAPEPAPVPAPVVPLADDRLQKTLAGLVEGQAEALKACNSDKSDRVRLRVELTRAGAVERVEPQGRSQSPTTRCVVEVVKAVRDPSLAGAGGLSLEVWVYFSPRFKVAVL